MPNSIAQGAALVTVGLYSFSEIYIWLTLIRKGIVLLTLLYLPVTAFITYIHMGEVPNIHKQDKIMVSSVFHIQY